MRARLLVLLSGLSLVSVAIAQESNRGKVEAYEQRKQMNKDLKKIQESERLERKRDAKFFNLMRKTVKDDYKKRRKAAKKEQQEAARAKAAQSQQSGGQQAQPQAQPQTATGE